MTAKEREVLSLPLYTESDQDILEMLATVPRGLIANTLKTLIRAGMAAEREKPAPQSNAGQTTSDTTAALLRELVEMNRKALDLAQKQYQLLQSGQFSLASGEDEAPKIKPRDDLLDDILGGLADWGQSGR